MQKRLYSFVFLLCLFPAVCHAQQAWQSGDLIFRRGTQTVSDLVMMADNAGFSHVGMLIANGTDWQVVHATPEEVPGRGNAVVMDSLAFFTSAELSEYYEIYHVQATPAQRKAAVHLALEGIGTPFTLTDPDGTYCTTFVWHAWLDAGVDLQVVFTYLRLPLIEGQYLLPSDLLASPLLRPVSLNPVSP